MSKDTTFAPGSPVPSQFLNEDQEGDTGLAWGLSLGQTAIAPQTLYLNVASGETQGAAVITGKKRWNTAPVTATATGVAGTRNIYLVGATSPSTGITLELNTGLSSAPLNRLVGTANWDGVTTLSNIRLKHGVQAEADQYNSFVFRPIATSTGETPITIRGYDGQANDNTKLLSVGAGTSGYTERAYITGTGIVGVELASSTAIFLRSRATGDTAGQYRYTQDASGKMVFADSAGANTATLERTGAGIVKIGNTLDVANLTTSGTGVIEVATHLNLASTKELRFNGTALASTHLSDSALLARLASPTFSGTVTVSGSPPAVDTSTTQVATTQWVINQGYSKSSVVGGTYAPTASPTFTGVPLAPTAAVDTNTTQLATTAFVIGQGYAKLASPTFTGTPSLPTGTTGVTQTPGDNTTKLATTAFAAAADTALAASMRAAANTWTGTAAFSAAVTVSAGLTMSGSNTITLGPTASTTGTISATGLSFSVASGAYSVVSTNAFGLGTAGSADWVVTRTGVGVAELGTNQVIRDNRSAATVLASGNAADLVPKTYVDTEVAKVSTKVKTVTASTDTTTTTAHDTVFVNFAGAVTITLSSYSAVGNTGKTITFKDISGACSAANAITVDANGAETIDGATTYVLNTAYEWVTIRSNGTNWFVVG